MSLDIEGFDKKVQGSIVRIQVENKHPLIKLCNTLDWEALLNAAFQLFCGSAILKRWHVPDHTKIEDFRSRLSSETQRQLANHLAVLGSRFNYANPSELDIDSTVQEANMAYPSNAGLLVRLACIAKRLVDPINHLKESVTEKIVSAL